MRKIRNRARNRNANSFAIANETPAIDVKPSSTATRPIRKKTSASFSMGFSSGSLLLGLTRLDDQAALPVDVPRLGHLDGAPHLDARVDRRITKIEALDLSLGGLHLHRLALDEGFHGAVDRSGARRHGGVLWRAARGLRL